MQHEIQFVKNEYKYKTGKQKSALAKEEAKVKTKRERLAGWMGVIVDRGVSDVIGRNGPNRNCIDDDGDWIA